MSTEFCTWPRTTNLWLRFYLGPFSSVNGNATLEHRCQAGKSLPLCALSSVQAPGLQEVLVQSLW